MISLIHYGILIIVVRLKINASEVCIRTVLLLNYDIQYIYYFHFMANYEEIGSKTSHKTEKQSDTKLESIH
ncbi:MAG: hypothetical protein K0R46_1293 [Herbinix sp.]|jgi:phospholipase C|nr:hypothetical protein [Herbinix sp.]